MSSQASDSHSIVDISSPSPAPACLPLLTVPPSEIITAVQYTSCHTCKLSEFDQDPLKKRLKISCTLCESQWHDECIPLDPGANIDMDDTWVCPDCVNPHGGRWDKTMYVLTILHHLLFYLLIIQKGQ